MKEMRMFYPIKKVNELLAWPKVCVTLPTYDLECNDAKAINICFLSQVTTHGVFWSHITSAIQIQNIKKYKKMYP